MHLNDAEVAMLADAADVRLFCDLTLLGDELVRRGLLAVVPHSGGLFRFSITDKGRAALADMDDTGGAFPERGECEDCETVGALRNCDECGRMKCAACWCWRHYKDVCGCCEDARDDEGGE